MDSLRLMGARNGVDGFRFDRPPVLGRTAYEFSSFIRFLRALRQIPLVKPNLLQNRGILVMAVMIGQFVKLVRGNDKYRDT